MRFSVLALLGLAVALPSCTADAPKTTEPDVGVVLTPVFEPPDGYPYPLGDISGQIGGAAVAWKSYDYSVGAIDPAVWLQSYDGKMNFLASFDPVQNPDGPGPRLLIEGTPDGLLAVGMTVPVAVTIRDGKTRTSPLIRSDAAGMLRITGFVEGGSGEYDRIRGSVTGTLCAAPGLDCLQMDLTFDTGVYQNDW